MNENRFAVVTRSWGPRRPTSGRTRAKRRTEEDATDQTRFDQVLNVLANSTGRRGAMHSLGAVGTVLLAASGLAEASAADSKRNRAGGNGRGGRENGAVRTERQKKKRCRKSCPAGPAAPALATRLVISPLSDPLPVTAGAVVLAVAGCGGAGKVVSCGYQMFGSPAQLVNAFVRAVAPNDDERVECVANLQRTTDVGSTAGAQIVAKAICLD